MILPNVRASFGRDEARWLVRLLSDGDRGRRRHWEAVLAERGIDPLLDDPGTLTAILAQPGVAPLPAGLVIYVMLRQVLLGRGIESRVLADYVAALVVSFGRGKRALRIAEHDDREYGYLIDIIGELDEATGRRAFLLRAHLGNFSLWLSGLFPDHITSRVHRRGGPGLDYYEEMGRTAFHLAADHPVARGASLDDLFRDVATAFGPMRRALNHFSDDFMFPVAASPADRVLRQAQNDFQDNELRQ